MSGRCVTVRAPVEGALVGVMRDKVTLGRLTNVSGGEALHVTLEGVYDSNAVD